MERNQKDKDRGKDTGKNPKNQEKDKKEECQSDRAPTIKTKESIYLDIQLISHFHLCLVLSLLETDFMTMEETSENKILEN